MTAKGGVAEAWFRLGRIHCAGLGVPQDYTRGFGCYAGAAKRGMPEAQHNVGAMLVSARGVKRDYAEGLARIILPGKSGADSGAEAKVRARLAHRPADIAAAEARAAVLWDGFKHDKAVAPDATFPGAEPKPAEPAPFQPERAALPKVDLAAPKVEIPVAPPAGTSSRQIVSSR